MSLFLLITLAIIFAIRRMRRKISKNPNIDSLEPSTPSQAPRAPTPCLILEIDNNSLCGPIRELPDNGQAELLDHQSPSGSGIETSEMSQPLPISTVAHELRTHRSSQEYSVVHARNANKILMSTSISRKSWTSLKSVDGTPCVETVISASIMRNIFDVGRSSTPTSNLEEQIYSSYMRKPLDLNRSLPPTPISESPQLSPIVPGLDSSFSVGIHHPKVNPVAHVSRNALLFPKTTVSKNSKALVDASIRKSTFH